MYLGKNMEWELNNKSNDLISGEQLMPWLTSDMHLIQAKKHGKKKCY